MTAPAMPRDAGLTPEQLARVIRLGLGGSHLRPWLHGARRPTGDVCAGGTMDGTFWQADRAGIRSNCGDLITWTQVCDVIDRGARVPGLRDAYEAAYAQWCAFDHGYHPSRAAWTETQRDDHSTRYRRVATALQATTDAILAAGCTTSYQQDALF